MGGSQPAVVSASVELHNQTKLGIEGIHPSGARVRLPLRDRQTVTALDIACIPYFQSAFGSRSHIPDDLPQQASVRVPRSVIKNAENI